MNLISKHLNKENLHHAYLIEGRRDKIVPEVLAFCEEIGIKTLGNPDFCNILIDNFKIDDAFELRSLASDMGFTSAKKVFIICANTFSLDAQNVLLRIFEEPTEKTHFFVIVPDAGALLKTLISRFYFISPKTVLGEEAKDAEKFIAMSLRNRIDFIKELLAEEEAPTLEEVGAPTESVGADTFSDSSRSKALKFLNALESVLHQKMSRGILDKVSMSKMPLDSFEHFFKVREFLRMPGSSTKTLMESVALIVPNF